MARFCDKCGTEIKEGSKFCDKCGNKIAAINQNNPSTGTTFSCPYCGQKIPYSTRCPRCGKSLKSDDAAKIGLGIIAIIILTFLMIGISGFLLIIFYGGA